MGNMKNTGRRSLAALAGLGLALAGSAGCQTNVAGMTLPSPRYLNHPPQYFAPSPPFPLARELATQEAYAAAAAPGAAPLPPPVVQPVVPPPPVVPGARPDVPPPPPPG
jgi:hypothetical protein